MSSKVSFENVSKKYYLTKTKTDKLLSMISSRFDKGGFYAVRNVSFDVKEGETIGFVGINGSGKSTLSNLLAKIIPPTKGTIKMNGQPSLIAIAAGLNNALTGKDNIYLKCLMMGLSTREIDELYDSIVEFADIGDFIDQPVKSYSSGMKSRLGFAISVHIEPDILIIDEALSVGDQTFYQKCVNKITDFKKQGKTIFFVSHSIGQIEKICDRVIWMHYGELKMFDETKVVVKEYKEFINWYNGLSKGEKEEYNAKNKEKRKQPLAIGQSESQQGIKRSQKQRKKNKKKNYSFMPILIMFMLMVGVAGTMFSEKPLRTIASFGLIGGDSVSQSDKSATEESVSEAVEVNEDGYIISDGATIYSNEELTEAAGVIPFGMPITLIEKSDSYAFIQSGGVSGYMELNDIQAVGRQIEQAELTMEELSGYISSKAANSYEFLMSFLGSDKAKLQEVMNGIEEIETDGQRMMHLSYENVYYILDEQDVAKGIIFNQFGSIDMENLSLEDNEVIQSEDQSRYVFYTDEAMVSINNDAGQLMYLRIE